MFMHSTFPPPSIRPNYSPKTLIYVCDSCGLQTTIVDVPPCNNISGRARAHALSLSLSLSLSRVCFTCVSFAKKDDNVIASTNNIASTNGDHDNDDLGDRGGWCKCTTDRQWLLSSFVHSFVHWFIGSLVAPHTSLPCIVRSDSSSIAADVVDYIPLLWSVVLMTPRPSYWKQMMRERERER